MTPTLTPVQDPLPSEVSALLKGYPRRDGYLLQLFRVFANSTRFLRKGTHNLLDFRSPLSLRLREIVILRVTANLGCEYEWGVHVTAFASTAQLTKAQIEATRLGDHDSEVWPHDEQLLIATVDQLSFAAKLEPETLADFWETWSVEQQLEIFALVGNYHTVSFVANNARLDPEPFAASFPSMERDLPLTPMPVRVPLPAS